MFSVKTKINKDQQGFKVSLIWDLNEMVLWGFNFAESIPTLFMHVFVYIR